MQKDEAAYQNAKKGLVRFKKKAMKENANAADEALVFQDEGDSPSPNQDGINIRSR